MSMDIRVDDHKRVYMHLRGREEIYVFVLKDTSSYSVSIWDEGESLAICFSQEGLLKLRDKIDEALENGLGPCPDPDLEHEKTKIEEAEHEQERN